MPGYKIVTLRGLGGLNEDENLAAFRNTDLVLANNTARLGTLTGTRPGTEYDANGEYSAAVAGGGPVQGFIEWTTGFDTTRHFVAVVDGKVYEDESTEILKATHSVTISNGNDDRWTFSGHNNVLYAAGGAAGDDVWYWLPADDHMHILDIVNSSAASIQPKYIFAWKSYLFLCGLNGALPDDNPMVWRYPTIGSDFTDPANWPPGNTIGGGGIGGMPSYGSDFSTGTASFQDNTGEYLLCLTNRRIYSYILTPYQLNTFQHNDTIANGCVSQHAFVDLGMDSGDAIYVSNHGIHSLRLSQQYSGRSRAFLSWPIRKTWATLNRGRMQYIVGGYWPTEGIVAFAVATGSSTTNNLILAMDIQGAQEITPDTVRWYKWYLDSSITLNMLGFARDSDNIPRLYCGGQAGEIFQFTRDVYSDLGSGYPVAFQTKHDDFGAPGVSKTVGDTHLLVKGSGAYNPTHRLIFDYGITNGPATEIELPLAESYWDSALWDIGTWDGLYSINREKIFGYGEAETVSHHFSHGGINESFFIGSIAQEVAPSGEASAESE